LFVFSSFIFYAHSNKKKESRKKERMNNLEEEIHQATTKLITKLNQKCLEGNNEWDHDSLAIEIEGIHK
jgi:hypothetical protein